MTNALTIDVEDYYHVSAFEPYIRMEEWQYLPSRVEGNVARTLDILDEYRTKATFFVLGWVAEKRPSLVRDIHARGHEIACHGYQHRLVYKMSQEEFRRDIRRAKAVIEDSVGTDIKGFRATSYSFVSDSLWGLDILIEEGFSYDSSIFPVHHTSYGIPKWDRFPHIIKRDSGSIYELPPSTVRIFNTNMPIAGGAYLRFLPLSLITFGIRRINSVESKPAVIYMHPWEIDSGQPCIEVNRLTKLRHYTGIDRLENKLRRILSEFSFSTVKAVINETLLN